MEIKLADAADPRGDWKRERMARIRRRIEDALWKTADWSLLLRIARLLNVKID